MKRVQSSHAMSAGRNAWSMIASEIWCVGPRQYGSRHLYTKPPGIQYPKHGIKEAVIPLPERRSRFTLRFESKSIRMFKNMGISWIRSRASLIGQRREVTYSLYHLVCIIDPTLWCLYVNINI